MITSSQFLLMIAVHILCKDNVENFSNWFSNLCHSHALSPALFVTSLVLSIISNIISCILRYHWDYDNQANMVVLSCTFVDLKYMYSFGTCAVQINRHIIYRRCVLMHLLHIGELYLWNKACAAKEYNLSWNRKLCMLAKTLKCSSQTSQKLHNCKQYK